MTSSLVLLFVLSFFSAARAEPVRIDRIEASVNTSVILYSEVMQFRKTLPLRQQLDPLFSGTVLASKKLNATDSEIVEFLINERLITQHFPVGESDAEQEINGIQANNRIDRKTLKAALADQGFNFSDYSDLIKTSLSKRNLIDRDIRTKVFISDDDIKNHLVQNSQSEAEKNASLTYKLSIISFASENYKTPLLARASAQKLLDQIHAGEKFEGQEGTYTQEELSESIRNQVKYLKVGEVSPVFSSDQKNFFIVKLEDVKTAVTDATKKLKDEIRNQLYLIEYQRQIALWLDRNRQAAFIHLAEK